MSRYFLILSLFLPALSATVSSGPLSASQPGAFTVATYNIRFANPGDGKDIWQNRRDEVASYVGQVDIIGLQEVTEPQFAFLRQSLPAYDSYGLGRDDGKSGGEHAPIFFRKDQFELLDQGTFWLSESPEQIGKAGWDAALPRTCTWVRLRQRDSGQVFWVANTHFDHVGAEARAESGKLIAERIGRMAGTSPIIVMGDFNCQPDSVPYNAIAAAFPDARSVSQAEPSGPNSTWSGFREIVPGRIIDHLFVRGAEVLKLGVFNPKTASGRFASDHLPVQATVRLAKDGD